MSCNRCYTTAGSCTVPTASAIFPRFTVLSLPQIFFKYLNEYLDVNLILSIAAFFKGATNRHLLTHVNR